MAYLTRIASASISGIDIHSAASIAGYTSASRARKVYVNAFLDKIAGNGNYTANLDVQRGGSGTIYPSMVTTNPVPSGSTSCYFPTIAQAMNTSDVMRVWVLGQAGDTASPIAIVDFYEEWENVDANGNPTVGSISASAINASAFAASAINNSVFTATVSAALGASSISACTLATDALTAESVSVDTQLSGTHGSGTWGSTGTGGTKTLIYTLTSSSDGSPVQGATIQLYGNSARTGAPIDSQITNILGQVTFSNLIAGTYYLTIIKAGYQEAYDQEVVS